MNLTGVAKKVAIPSNRVNGSYELDQAMACECGHAVAIPSNRVNGSYECGGGADAVYWYVSQSPLIGSMVPTREVQDRMDGPVPSQSPLIGSMVPTESTRRGDWVRYPYLVAIPSNRVNGSYSPYTITTSARGLSRNPL